MHFSVHCTLFELVGTNRKQNFISIALLTFYQAKYINYLQFIIDYALWYDNLKL